MKYNKKDISKIINNELGFTNGWWIPENDYEDHCDKAAKRIIALLKRRKLINTPSNNR